MVHKMSVTFEEIMEFHKRNRTIYNALVERYKEKSIIPFIGAGMSVAAGFKTWDAFLKSEYENFMDGYEMPTDPLEAASELSEILGIANFRNDVRIAFGATYTDNKWREILKTVKSAAVGLLPDLFNEVIVTTNYDRLLEHLYPSIVVSHPGHNGQLNRALQLGTSMVFKLHGCISEVEEIILTRESYDRVYNSQDHTDTRRALEYILTSQTVLFLGCSLKDDYTIRHWERMIHQPTGIGIEHFAIVGCSVSDRQKKSRELGDKNILSILYNENNHDAVRVVLQQLYYDTKGNTPKTNLPDQNQWFTGRKKELGRIKDLFSKRGQNRINIYQTVSGLGGIGKTQLAVKYAYDCIDQYRDGIWFVNAETSATVQRYFSDFAKHFNLSLSPQYDSQELQLAVKLWLSEHNDWLLILDNVEYMSTVESYLPIVVKGHVIITTRSANIDYGSPIILDVFEKPEALKFLKKRLSANEKLEIEYYNNDSNDFEAKAPELINRLGCFPLALEQAAAYIRNTKCTITSYLKILKETGILVFEDEYAEPEHYTKVDRFERIVTATWNISFKGICSEGARQLLNLCAYMAPDKIPVSFFVEMREKLPFPIKEDLATEQGKNKIVTELRMYSLTGGTADYINIHRLVQEVIRRSHDEATA